MSNDRARLLSFLLTAGLSSAALGCSDTVASQSQPNSGAGGAPSETPADICGGTGKVYGLVVTNGALAAEDTDYVGLDLDGAVSEEADPASCNKIDLVDPVYGKGADNQFSAILDTAAVVAPDVGLSNITTILSSAFQNGQLLLVMKIWGVDDAVNDDCIMLELGEGTGQPLFAEETIEVNGVSGTVARHVPYQTFGWDGARAPVSRARGRIVDGELQLEPSEITIPVSALDADFNLPIKQGQARMFVTEDPDGPGISIQGMMGGGIEPQALVDIVSELNVDKSFLDLVESLGGGFADLAPDENGTCTLISAGIYFETRPAYVSAELSENYTPTEE